MNKRATHIRLASRYIEPSPGVKLVTKEANASVKDIVDTVLLADKLSGPFTKRYAPFLRAGTDRATLKNIWRFVRNEITYKPDVAQQEVVNSPGQTWQIRTGDCKSMSVMVGSLLKNLGYSYYYRVAFYDPAQPRVGHIYAIAVLQDGTEVIVDPVVDRFDYEHPYWKKEDFKPVPSKLRGPGVLVPNTSTGTSKEVLVPNTTATAPPSFGTAVGLALAVWAIIKLA